MTQSRIYLRKNYNNSHLFHLKDITLGWLILLIPLLGLVFSSYYAYLALKNNRKSRKTLVYVIFILAAGETYYFNLDKISLILLALLLVIVSITYLYLKKNKSYPITIISIFNTVNNYLDSIGNRKLRSQIQVNNADIEMRRIDNLNGLNFENYMVRLLKSIGYKDVKHTPDSNDYGLDAIGYSPDGRYRIGWQFKHYSHGEVGYNAVEQTMGGSAFYHTDYNYLLTNTNNITANTKKGIQGINDNGKHYISLQDRDTLFEFVKMNEKHLHFNSKGKIVNDKNVVKE